MSTYNRENEMPDDEPNNLQGGGKDGGDGGKGAREKVNSFSPLLCLTPRPRTLRNESMPRGKVE